MFHVKQTEKVIKFTDGKYLGFYFVINQNHIKYSFKI